MLLSSYDHILKTQFKQPNRQPFLCSQNLRQDFIGWVYLRIIHLCRRKKGTTFSPKPFKSIYKQWTSKFYSNRSPSSLILNLFSFDVIEIYRYSKIITSLFQTQSFYNLRTKLSFTETVGNLLLYIRRTIKLLTNLVRYPKRAYVIVAESFLR